MSRFVSFARRLLGAVLVCLSILQPLYGAGSLDTTFIPNLDATPNSMVVQPDGKILVAGSFTNVNGTARRNLARLNADGTLDTSFNAAFDDGPTSLIVLGEGRTVVGGGFSNVGGATHNRLARLFSDGSVDNTFNPNLDGVVNGTAVQPDGKILVAGTFKTVNGNARSYLVRLNVDGGLDFGFNHVVDGSVNTVVVQSDGKILVLGAFNYVGNQARTGIARLNADGSLDTSFNVVSDFPVYAAVPQPDGKVLLGGTFTQIDGATRLGIARINTDNSLDPEYYPNVNGTVFSMALQADGRLVVGGNFSVINGLTRINVARINSDGGVDVNFVANAAGFNGSGASVSATVLQGDGAVLLGGSFAFVNSTGRARLARVSNDPTFFKLTTSGTNSSYTVRFFYGGSVPEAQAVSFDASDERGTTFTTPVYGTRITGGWQATISLPAASGQLRVRLRPAGGANSAGGLVQQVTVYPMPDISLEQAGTPLADNASTVDFGETPLGGIVRRSFTIRNVGAGTLRVGGVALDGANPYDFSVDTSATSLVLASGGATTFDVVFAPKTTSYQRGAIVRVASNVYGASNPFDINLTALGLSTTTSLTNDGLNDHAKYLLAALGFNWQQNQFALVQTYYNAAPAAGLYTTAQVQTLYVGTPLLQKDAGTGQFKLTITVRQSADLQTYTTLSLSAGTTTINASGALEFRFNSPSAAQFYRLQSQ